MSILDLIFMINDGLQYAFDTIPCEVTTYIPIHVIHEYIRYK